MSLFVASLNSGSNGNCYYLGTMDDAVLVDAGISCREIEKRLKRTGLNIRKVRAIFISHEHGDHTHGAPALSRKHNLPVYITPATLEHSNLRFREDLIRNFTTDAPVQVGAISVTAFMKAHDARDPHSFVVRHGDVSVGVFTDIGKVCPNVTAQFAACHAVFLEANYDEDMLDRGSYPYHLKARIKGGQGHLSNDQALSLFREHRSSYLSHLFLSHLSQDNNTPRLVQTMFSRHAGDTKIVVAPRDRETQVYHIRQWQRSMPNRLTRPATEQQLALF